MPTNYQKLQEEILALEKQLQLLQNEISKLPPGKLCITQSKKYFRYYHSDGNTSSYISTKNHKLIKELVTKMYLDLKQKYLTNEYHNMLSCLKRHNSNIDKSQLLLNKSSIYRELLSSYFVENNPSEQEWNNIPYETNPNYPERLLHPSASGNVLRSKSEYMIDTALYEAKIKFRYECKLVLDDSVFYPDFTILHPKSKQILYWEHFGMMDSPTYTSKTFTKLKFYISHGFIPNINLITTYETQKHPLTYDQIDRIINNFLLY